MGEWRGGGGEVRWFSSHTVGSVNIHDANKSPFCSVHVRTCCYSIVERFI